MGKKKNLSITEIENSVNTLINHLKEKDFITEFLSFYDIPKTSITRAKVKFDKGEPFIIKNKVYYTEIQGEVITAIDAIEHEILNQKSKPRYLIANNYSEIAALDIKTRDTLNIPLSELPSKADFFLAWNGIEKSDYQSEHPADRKAAERFAKLYDVLEKDNPNVKEHSFNTFLIRILFLLFAEDTGIMKKGIFTNTLKIRTKEDGSNLNEVIEELFEILNTNELNRDKKSDWLKIFPYVNGKLFSEPHVSLIFTKKSRKLLIEAGELLNWNEINPDILGSMIQTVSSSKKRQVSGMHYTSVPNIMKVIKPLFLDELYKIFNDLSAQYEENKIKNITEKTKKNYNKKIINSLSDLLERISRINFLDPACGSGNFLIIAYKEIRRLEIKILVLLDEIQQSDTMPMTAIHLENYNGIEVDDFAHEVAKLSLWIAEHQMNEEMEKALPGYISALLPLKDSGNIVLGNALRIDWNNIIPQNKNEEIYIFGNPPYIGAANKNENQKNDLAFVFHDTDISFGKLDYITGWFYKSVKFMEKRKSVFAFVSTNSIVQGEQVSLIWPELFKTAQISFAYPSFKWSNNAKSNAGVTVVIIGFEYKDYLGPKSIYSSNGTVKKVDNITPYLVEGVNIIVEKENKSINGFTEMVKGSSPTDDGGLIFSEYEYQQAIELYPNLKDILKKYQGSREYINDISRYVLWMSDDDAKLFKNNPIISKRLEHVRQFRLNKKGNTLKKAETPWEFVSNGKRKAALKKNKNMKQILIPRVSSENRYYVPMGYVNKDTIISDSSMAIYDAPLWLLGLLQSRMHMVWLRAIGGKLKTDYRYSSGLVYNTFPIRRLSPQRLKEIERVITDILDLREYEGGSLAYLYNSKTMPISLKEKHQELDGIVERAYRQKPFNSDEERLSTLLTLYKEKKVIVDDN
ncbi:N-6 DNA methylase [Staphylococcus pseudintermedius]|uniref:class I SAM-dependent DNA methyltransferase n=1 Tax=Staphylococcus TaxID=1279 RepID=UPI001E60F023|nr:DNA methyltransferase [Staphylococcus epidermidis]MCD8922981.1 N-6 DNA methylase [Staphylococcus epidermidis]MCD9057810.1 N-6 DNA methylase [Staphylococcus epidermidis]MEB5736333.1 N-6 DNA methylase [Staphylococcus epidermidis]MEB7071728.1 N-6 DNA methylase [Staphylococcus epidermidis]MEB7387679.1 N-6 DNA methylase [Staphylococcus epidermidis]